METQSLSQGIFNLLLAKYDIYFVEIFDTLMSSFRPLFVSILSLWTVFKGYELATNKGEQPVFEILKTYLITVVLYFFVLETQAYREWIVGPFLLELNNLCAFFTGLHSAQLFEALDKQAMLFLDSTTNIFSWSLNPADYVFQFVAFLVLNFVFFAMFFAFLAIYCISYFSMNIFFLVGGIFLLFGAIKKTRGLFYAWLRNLCQFALTIIFASITLGLCFEGITNAVKKLADLDTANFWTLDFFSLIGWCLITIALFLKSSDFAAGLTTTMAGSTYQMAAAMSSAGGKTAAVSAGMSALGLKGGGAAAGWLDQKTGGHVGNAYERLKQRFGASE